MIKLLISTQLSILSNSITIIFSIKILEAYFFIFKNNNFTSVRLFSFNFDHVHALILNDFELCRRI
jgi:hypothetical protein